MEFEFYVWFSEPGFNAIRIAGFNCAEDAISFAQTQRNGMEREDCQYIAMDADGNDLEPGITILTVCAQHQRAIFRANGGFKPR